MSPPRADGGKPVFVTVSAHPHDEGIGIGVSAANEDGKLLKRLAYVYEHEDMSMEQAEYAALLEAIMLAKATSPTYVVFCLRSREVRDRLLRGAPVPRELRPLHRCVQRALESVLPVRWAMWWVERKAAPADA